MNVATLVGPDTTSLLCLGNGSMIYVAAMMCRI